MMKWKEPEGLTLEGRANRSLIHRPRERKEKARWEKNREFPHVASAKQQMNMNMGNQQGMQQMGAMGNQQQMNICNVCADWTAID